MRSASYGLIGLAIIAGIVSLVNHFGYFRQAGDIFMDVYGEHSGPSEGPAVVRPYLQRMAAKTDGRCSFAFEAKTGYGYRVYGFLVVDESK